MNEYGILDMTDDENIHVIIQSAARQGALDELREIAEVGKTYHEVKLIGAPIVPKERTAVTLTRVQPEQKPDGKVTKEKDGKQSKAKED